MIHNGSLIITELLSPALIISPHLFNDVHCSPEEVTEAVETQVLGERRSQPKIHDILVSNAYYRNM